MRELLQDRFINDVKKVLADVDSIKLRQFTGSDSVRMERIFSDLSADVSFNNVGFDDTRFYLVFTPASTNFDTSLVYKMEYTYTETPTDSSVSIEWQRLKVETGNVQKWLFVVSGSDFDPNTLVTMKFYFWASGDGTFAIETF